jgi:ATP phosphoribosyltransferase regulatory subunit
MRDVLTALDQALTKAGNPAPDIGALMPLSVILDLVGEEVRPRLCVLVTESGDETCLRPDFTLPLALHWQARTEAEPVRWRYQGPAYRYPVTSEPGVQEGAEFIQTGFEWFGAEAREDSAALALALDAAHATGLAATDCRLHLGDAALFPALVDALALGPVWTSRLKRAMATKAGPLPLIRNGVSARGGQGLASALSGLGARAREEVVAGLLNLSGLEPVSGRTPAVIAARLGRQADASEVGPLPDAAKAVLERVLTFSGALDDGLRLLEEIVRLPGMAALTEVTQSFAARRDALAALAPQGLSNAVFSASFGRRFDYYDGFLFELTHAALGLHRAVLSGGRYDGLVVRLSGGTRSIPAIGAVLRPARIAEALGTGGRS